MWKQNNTNKLTYKTETDSQTENKHGYQKGNGGINQKYRINRYTRIYCVAVGTAFNIL